MADRGTGLPLRRQVKYVDVEVPTVQHREVPVERRVEIPVPVPHIESARSEREAACTQSYHVRRCAMGLAAGTGTGT